MPKNLKIDIDEPTWKRVIVYRIENNLKSNNATIVQLIKKGLKK